MAHSAISYRVAVVRLVGIVWLALAVSSSWALEIQVEATDITIFLPDRGERQSKPSASATSVVGRLRAAKLSGVVGQSGAELSAPLVTGILVRNRNDVSVELQGVRIVDAAFELTGPVNIRSEGIALQAHRAKVLAEEIKLVAPVIDTPSGRTQANWGRLIQAPPTGIWPYSLELTGNVRSQWSYQP